MKIRSAAWKWIAGAWTVLFLSAVCANDPERPAVFQAQKQLDIDSFELPPEFGCWSKKEVILRTQPLADY
jgi:hypothetical protein